MAGDGSAHRRGRGQPAAPRIARLLATADWSYFYTPYDAADPVVGPGQLRGGFWTDTGEPTAHHYGALNTEPRMASYLGIADGSIPSDHYWHMFRTMLPEHGQEQSPGGAYDTVDGVRLWQGHYTYRAASWSRPGAARCSKP